MSTEPRLLPSLEHTGTRPPVQLTAQERRIAELAGQGLTNKEIGLVLKLSARTVGTYLYGVYPKLGISSRVALGDALDMLDAPTAIVPALGTGSGAALLSPAELRVARAAARGLTNREVAELLGLSPRTVQVHLYRLFPKLGIGSRAGLRGALRGWPSEATDSRTPAGSAAHRSGELRTA